MRHLAPVLLSAWILWLTDGKSWSPHGGFETKKDCEIGLHDELRLLRMGRMKVNVETNTIWSFSGKIARYLCLPDTVNPKR